MGVYPLRMVHVGSFRFSIWGFWGKVLIPHCEEGMLAFVAYAISHLSGSGFQRESNHLQHMFPDWVSKGAGEAEAKVPRGAETLLLAD
jgi:hypothetical protein